MTHTLSCIALGMSSVVSVATRRRASASGTSAVRASVPSLRLDRDAIFWHYPHYHPGGATPSSAIRAGTLRLVHFYEDARDRP
jgi:hypothetical protein